MHRLHRLAGLLAGLDGYDLGITVSLLPASRLVEVRCGLDIAAGRADTLLADRLREDYVGGRYHRPALLAEITELDRLRYPPTGDRQMWITYGPAGPPHWHAREAAA